MGGHHILAAALQSQILAASCVFTSPPQDLSASGAEFVSFVSPVTSHGAGYLLPNVPWAQDAALNMPSSVLFLLFKMRFSSVPEATKLPIWEIASHSVSACPIGPSEQDASNH